MMMRKNLEHQARTVLVIDDEAPVREAVEDVMMMLGVKVLAAENGREGINLYQKHMTEIDLILLDLSMPGLSGKETLHELRQLNPAVKVILSSGYSAPELIPKVDANTAFLQKPYDIEKLIARIRHYLP